MTDAERDELLRKWISPPSNTEDERASNAERVIKDAIQQSRRLDGRKLRFFVQGSYRNNTNVRFESDVDVCVCLTETINSDYSKTPLLSNEVLGLAQADYTAQELKDDLTDLLLRAFGKANVSRGDKAINVRANTFRVTADVVPCVKHLRWVGGAQSPEEGIALFTDGGSVIVNFPEQHHRSGVIKNNATGGFYKDAVRVLKNLRNTMADEGWQVAAEVPSFLNECLAWNLPDGVLRLKTWNETIKGSLEYLYGTIVDDGSWSQMEQVSRMFHLLHGPNSFSRTVARDWIQAAWHRLEY